MYVKGEKLFIWYEIHNPNVQAVNEKLEEANMGQFSFMKITNVALELLTVGEIFEENTKEMLTVATKYLYQRLAIIKEGKVRIPQVLCFSLDDSRYFKLTYEAIFMGQLIRTGLEKWNFYMAYKHEFPTEQDLKDCKVVIFPGSAYDAYKDDIEWIVACRNIVTKIYREYPHIKLIGGCFGS